MIKIYINKCRDNISLLFISTNVYKRYQPVLGTLILLFIIIPALLNGCIPVPAADYPLPEKIAGLELKSSGNPDEIGNLDIFVFYDDSIRKLDCYQRYDDISRWEGKIISGYGDRLVTAIANSHLSKDDWAGIYSHSHLKSVKFRLEDEDRERAVMEGSIRMGEDELVLKRFASEIVLQSIRCDFSGRPYQGEVLDDVKVYLTNVCAEFGLLQKEEDAPTRIINAGRLNEEDADNFKDKGLIVRQIHSKIGKDIVYPDIRLWCYPSNFPMEGPGTPYTRLVIEGKIRGRTYYWPININRDTEYMPGIWRNCSYIYDIIITRKGSTDPDIPVSTENISINYSVKEWKEKEKYSVSF